MYNADLARDPRIIGMHGMIERLLEESKVYFALAENPALPDFPIDAIERLIRSSACDRVVQRSDLPWESPRLAPYAVLRGGLISAARRQDLENYPSAAQVLAMYPKESVRVALASNPAIARFSDLLALLASDVAAVRRALASNPALPNFPGNIVHSLITDPLIFWGTISSRHDLPWDYPPFVSYAVLRGTWSDHERVARSLALERFPEAAQMLVRHPARPVRVALASNPSVVRAEGILSEIADGGDRLARMVLAKNAAIACLPQMIKRFSCARDRGIRCAIAANPSIYQYPEVVFELLRDSQVVRQGLAANPSLSLLPSGAVADLLADAYIFFTEISWREDLPWEQPPFAPYAILRGDWEKHRQIAQQTNHPLAVKMLSMHPNHKVRQSLALSSSLSAYPEVAASLARDGDPDVRRSLAANPVISHWPELVENLLRDYPLVRRGLAANPSFLSFSDEVIKDLVLSADIFFWEIAKRDDLPWDQPPFAPYAILRGGLDEHLNAAQRPDLDKYPEAAQMLTLHPIAEVRIALAVNPVISRLPTVVYRLLRDADSRIQDALAWYTKGERRFGWIEIKTINRRHYRYLRWYEGQKKRSFYLGKA